MKIYFTSSTAQFAKYKKHYYAIRDFLVKENHVLTHDWYDTVDLRIKSKIPEIKNMKEIYEQCKNGIADAELVIIEDTVSNFSTGHQITLALQRQKPTLVLWSEKKHKHFKQMFIHGIESEYLEIKEYNLENYEEVIKEFLNKYENARARNRFHLVLGDVERKYLDWAQFNKGKSRTKVIREALKGAIENDEEYSKYLISKS